MRVVTQRCNQSHKGAFLSAKHEVQRICVQPLPATKAPSTRQNTRCNQICVKALPQPQLICEVQADLRETYKGAFYSKQPDFKSLSAPKAPPTPRSAASQHSAGSLTTRGITPKSNNGGPHEKCTTTKSPGHAGVLQTKDNMPTRKPPGLHSSCRNPTALQGPCARGRH